MLAGIITLHVCFHPWKHIYIIAHPRSGTLIYLFCRTHWQILSSPPFWRYSQSRILLYLTGIVTCIKSIMAHTCGGIPSYVFCRPRRYCHLSFIYSAVHIGRYCHLHPFGSIPSHVFCCPQQVLSPTSNYIHLWLPPKYRWSWVDILWDPDLGYGIFCGS